MLWQSETEPKMELTMGYFSKYTVISHVTRRFGERLIQSEGASVCLMCKCESEFFFFLNL